MTWKDRSNHIFNPLPEYLCPGADSCSLRVSCRVVADARQLSQPVDQYQYQSRG